MGRVSSRARKTVNPGRWQVITRSGSNAGPFYFGWASRLRFTFDRRAITISISKASHAAGHERIRSPNLGSEWSRAYEVPAFGERGIGVLLRRRQSWSPSQKQKGPGPQDRGLFVFVFYLRVPDFRSRSTLACRVERGKWSGPGRGLCEDRRLDKTPTIFVGCARLPSHRNTKRTANCRRGSHRGGAPDRNACNASADRCTAGSRRNATEQGEKKQRRNHDDGNHCTPRR